MISLSENLLETIKNYANEEKLVLKWSQILEQLKVFDDELIEIKEQLKKTLKDGNLKDIDKIEQRSFNLKFKIINKVFLYYLILSIKLYKFSI